MKTRKKQLQTPRKKNRENIGFSDILSISLKEAQTGFEPVHQGVADPRLTAWLLRLTMSTRRRKIPRLLCSHAAAVRKESSDCETANDPDGNRTRVTAVKGRCLNRLTTGPSIGRCFRSDRVIY